MVRHIIMWDFAKGFTKEQNMENAAKMKEELESLTHCIDEVIELKVSFASLPSSNADIILNSLFESEEALAAYQIHPEHQRVRAYVHTVTENRRCMDYLD